MYPPALIPDNANVVPKKAHVGSGSERETDFILDRCLSHVNSSCIRH
jgi:hypothetical protein